MRKTLCGSSAVLLLFCSSLLAHGQQGLTWQQVRERFLTANPTLLADRLNLAESRADEITAYLRPNPNLSLTADGTQIAPNKGVWLPLTGTFESAGINYLHERQHKRELRLQSAQAATQISTSSHADLERALLFQLRSAFLSVLQAKSVRQLAKDNLAYYDHVLDVSRERFHAGDIAQVDFDRLELQRIQYVSDLQTAEVNLRTAKIELLTLMNQRTPVEQFEVEGRFDFDDQLQPLEEVRKQAIASRPDLQAAIEAVQKADTDHKLVTANGSTDLTLSAWYTHNGSYNNPLAVNTLGLSVEFPLRIFDRNQGEKLRTQIEISRSQRLREVTESAVLGDVDSGYATLSSTLSLLRPYRSQYLEQSARVRDMIDFSYQHGGSSLLDFLNAQAEYRTVQLTYLNLVGSYLTAAAQLNMAVGQEVVP